MKVLFSLCVLDGERFGSRLYRRASNRHISRIVATVIVTCVWIFVCKIIVILDVLPEREAVSSHLSVHISIGKLNT